jgi:hypothetical protein
MGFEVFVGWYENGQPARVHFSAVHAAFGGAAAHPEADGFCVRYGPADESYVYATRGVDGAVDHLMIARPCGADGLWDGIVAVMRLGNGLCYWPPGACAVASLDTVPHVPEDMGKGLGMPQLVRDGAALAGAIESP